MTRKLNRRGFMKTSLAASAMAPLIFKAGDTAAQTQEPPSAGAKETLPTGKLGEHQISRLILGGNLLAGYAHSRELTYVSTLMRRYNTPQKIRETLELAEANGITAINSWVQDDNSQIFEHWKNGGKLKWIAQTRLDSGGGFGQVQRAIDEGAIAIHLTGDTCEGLLYQGKFEKVAESVDYIQSRKKIAGIGAHDLRVIEESEKLKLKPDFYIKTFHSHEYFTAPKPGDTSAVGVNDNSWCKDPQAVVDVMAKVTRPWIAFKILAAGAIPPRAAFPYAFGSGADFVLVGMFDWQIADNAKLAKRVATIMAGGESKRTRPWFS